MCMDQVDIHAHTCTHTHTERRRWRSYSLSWLWKLQATGREFDSLLDCKQDSWDSTIHVVWMYIHWYWTVSAVLNITFSIFTTLYISSMYRANTWLGFGLSGSTSRTLMFGADVSIVWVDETDGPQAVDYYLSAYTQVSIQVFLNIFRFCNKDVCDIVQCRGGQGACPDTVDTTVGSCSNDVTLITGLKKDGQQCVVYSRKFAAGQTPSTSTTFLTSHLFLSPPNFLLSFSLLSLSLSCSAQVSITCCTTILVTSNAEDECDLALDPDEDQYIVWGVGGLGETAFQHFKRATSNKHANIHWLHCVKYDGKL